VKLRAFVSAPIGKSRNPLVFDKVGFIKVEYTTGKYTQKPEFQCFANDVDLGALAALTPGEEVDIEFDMTTKPVKDKAGNEVKVDGWAKWVNVATARSVRVVIGKGPEDPSKIPF
jgi:hypothetical protein